MIKRITIRNFRGIKRTRIPLSDFNVLVGPNGSGKSTLLQALHFLSSCVNRGTEYATSAFKLRIDPKGQDDILIRVEIDIIDATYIYTLRLSPEGFRWQISHEKLTRLVEGEWKEVFLRKMGSVITGDVEWTIRGNYLWLSLSGEDPQVTEVAEHLAAIKVYSLSTREIASGNEIQDTVSVDSSGSTSAAAFKKHPIRKKSDVVRFGQSVVPALGSISTFTSSGNVTFRFANKNSLKRYDATTAPTGLLHALAIALILNQPPQLAPVVCLEEPESGLHPGALPHLLDLLHKASSERQIFISTHSPELINDFSLSESHFILCKAHGDECLFSLVDASDRELMTSHLYTAGELLRDGTLT